MAVNGMISMKLAPAKKSTYDQPISLSREEYPYGMRLDLSKEQIKKLGLDVTTAKVGGKIRLIVDCTINRVSKSDSINNGGTSESMDLQVVAAKVVKEPGETKNFEHKKLAKPRD